VVILPRLARRLNSPAIATALAAILIVLGVAGLISNEIPNAYSIVIIVVGLVNLVRALPQPDHE
jgi:hypothetical protein